MYNWNTDTRMLRKSPAAFAVWRLNQLINFGLNGERIDLKEAKKYWNKLTLDPKRKKFLDYALWGKLS